MLVGGVNPKIKATELKREPNHGCRRLGNRTGGEERKKLALIGKGDREHRRIMAWGGGI